MSAPVPALRTGTAAGRGTLLAAILASGMVFLDSTVVNVALPRLGEELGANVADLQWTVNGYLLMLAAFVLLGGALGDRFGRRRVFLLGVVWFAGASLLCGLSQGTSWLIAARFLQGAGGALLTPGSLAVLQASFHPDDRGKAIGTWSGLSGVSTALGPLLGGWLIDALSWRWIFFINLPLAVAVVLAALRWVPESRDEAASRTGAGRRFDIAGALLGALGLGGVTYALIDAPARGAGSPAVLAAVLVGVLAAVVFVLVERRRGDAAMLPTGLFSSRLFSVLNLFTVAVYAALGGFTFFLAVYLQNVVGWSALLTGLATVPMTVLLLVGSARAGALSARIGPRLPLTVGPVLAALGLLLVRRVGPGASYWTDVLPGVALFGAGLTLVVAPLTASVLAAVADRFAGVASGFNNAASRAGGLLAVAALPLLVGLSGTGYEQKAALTGAFRGAMLWCAGLLLAGAALAGLLIHRPARTAPGAQPCPSLPASTPPDR
ncbi:MULTISPECIES: MFS transporter [Micromonospora]|uniref:DHA2 family efflux MFS transporter permease subunit n=1 Tax=Micromonospora solifontis TaxID=2487138 RepID=A0ABX9WC30_9ACTN|nr:MULTISPECIES: MFS transporter [Micromonospora]NES16477.1 MFS transporter [Micromonospora sp. PPF5-17B]NES38712.1 MFS transporter [Micromonospora solifontis]NES58165.1 MFS transporter [Micromonospora sp. PPF5-6]RNL93946.1 DHA2 family efflux MFS transporter permease subunit [Micromonospora solifontis]